jgi:MFS family permease
MPLRLLDRRRRATPVAVAGPAAAPRIGLVARVAGVLSSSYGDLGAPLRLPPFRWLWISTSAWNLARWMELPLTGWVALSLTGSPAAVALLGVTRTALLPLVAPISGALADRVDRVRLVRLAPWGNALVVCALAAALLAGKGAYWQLVLATLWLGLSWGLDWPARRALAADLVGPRQVLQAVLLDGVSQNIARVAGSLLAGGLLAARGGPGAVAVLAAVYVAAALAVLRVRVPRGAGQRAASPAPAEGPPGVVSPRRSVWREILAGLVAARRDPVVWAVLLVGVLMDALLMQYQTLLAVFAERVLAVGPVELGWMGAAAGVGATLGLLLLPLVRDGRHQALTYAWGSLLTGVAVLLFALAPVLPVALPLLVLAGLGTAAFATMQTTLLLSRTTPAMRGRILGLQALTIGSAPLGAFELSRLVEGLGAPLAVAINAAVCTVAVAAVSWRSGLLRPAPGVPEGGQAAPGRAA